MSSAMNKPRNDVSDRLEIAESAGLFERNVIFPLNAEPIHLESWLRSKARLAVDGLFCSSASEIQRFGDMETGWVIHTDPSPQVCYCAGVGNSMSFELKLAKTTGRSILVFDPSPTGIATVAASDTRNLHFFPIGIAANTGLIEFALPKDAGEGSYSVPQEGIEKISFECWNLTNIMSKNGDSSIDLLKMDIEGFEYDIIDQFLDQRIPIRQLCVEFHPWLRPGRTLKTIRKLYGAGYRIIHKHRGDHTFILKDSRYRQLLESALKLGSRPAEAP